MANISLTLYTNGFFGSILKSPIQMGSLSVKNSVTNISRLGTFKNQYKNHALTSEVSEAPTTFAILKTIYIFN
jgi:hypothetical protein